MSLILTGSLAVLCAQNGPKQSRIVLQSACESSKFCVPAGWNIVQKHMGNGFYQLPNHVTQLLFIDPFSDNVNIRVFAVSMALQLLCQLNGSITEGTIISAINYKIIFFNCLASMGWGGGRSLNLLVSSRLYRTAEVRSLSRFPYQSYFPYR